MSQNQTIIKHVDCQTVTNTTYDAVIVGAGVSGAITAKELSEQGYQVLILEAGAKKGVSVSARWSGVSFPHRSGSRTSPSKQEFCAVGLSKDRKPRWVLPAEARIVMQGITNS